MKYGSLAEPARESSGKYRSRATPRTSLIYLAVVIACLLVFLQGCSASNRSQGGETPRAETSQETDQGQASDNSREVQAGAESQEVPPFDPGTPAVIERGNPNRKRVAITIDDGWNKDDRILDLLESYDLKCTVFVIGGMGVGEAHPEWIKRMDRDGFEVCTHTYSHYKLTDRAEEWVSEDIRKGQAVIAQVTGKYYPYMRPPGGFYDSVVIRAATENSCKVVMWTSELGDTNAGITVDREVSAVLSNLCNGDIILCHFGGYHTYEALSRLIPEIENRGYRTGTLSEILAP